MKTLAAILGAFCLLLAACGEPQRRVEPVYDQAHLLSPSQKKMLTTQIVQHYKTTGVVIVVATTPSLNDREIAEVSLEFAQKAKIGRKGTDSGLVIFLAPTEKRVRIEVGYGMEGRVTDADCTQIIERMKPYFKEQHYAEGLLLGVHNLIGLTRR